MIQSIVPPAPATGLKGLALRVWQNPDGRSTTIGVAVVVVFHLLLVTLGPRLLVFGHTSLAPRDTGTARDFNIELAPEMFEKPPQPPEPSKFVETNPEAPENTPDKTKNFAAQNQQVAQEKPTPDGKSDRPAMEGKQDQESNQIVSGRLSNPVERVEPEPPAVNVPVAETPVVAPRAEQNPLSGQEKFLGENAAGFAGNIAKRLENARDVPEKVDGVKDAKAFEGATSLQPTIDPRKPRPRPQVVQTQQVRPAILAEQRIGTTNVGLTAIDAKFSQYGAYLQRMIDSVQIQWERIILQMTAMPAGGSTVSVKFIMNDEGKITKIQAFESTASETASRACVSAITDRSPYGPWTDDMKAVLGTQQEMTFTFFYQ
ncbi:MAG: hypothetical protein ABIQ12_08445 [Opitutaceae bacterium]